MGTGRMQQLKILVNIFRLIYCLYINYKKNKKDGLSIVQYFSSWYNQTKMKDCYFNKNPNLNKYWLLLTILRANTSHIYNNIFKSSTKVTNLSYFLNLATTFSNERATLTSRDHQPQGDWRFTGSCAIGHGAADVLQK